METNKQSESFIKNSIISTIIMLSEKVNGNLHTQYHYSYARLIEFEYSRLEEIRDRLITDYNEKIKED